MATSFKRSHVCTVAFSAPQPCTRPPLTHASIRDTWIPKAGLRQSLVGLLLLSPVSWCTGGSVCALQELVSPVPCKFWWLYGGVNGDLLQEGLCHTQVCCTRAPVCGRPLHTCTFAGDTQTQFWLFVGVSGSWCTQGLFEPSEHLWRGRGLILSMTSPLLPSCWGFSFDLGCGVSFFGGIQPSPADGYSATSCSFGVPAGEDEHMAFYFTILHHRKRLTASPRRKHLNKYMRR